MGRFVGLSLQECVQDIVDGKISINIVDRIYTNLNAKNAQAFRGFLLKEAANYWPNTPENSDNQEKCLAQALELIEATKLVPYDKAIGIPKSENGPWLDTEKEQQFFIVPGKPDSKAKWVPGYTNSLDPNVDKILNQERESNLFKASVPMTPTRKWDPNDKAMANTEFGLTIDRGIEVEAGADIPRFWQKIVEKPKPKAGGENPPGRPPHK